MTPAPRIAVAGGYATGFDHESGAASTGETLLEPGYRVDYGGKGSNQAVAHGSAGRSASLRASEKIPWRNGAAVFIATKPMSRT